MLPNPDMNTYMSFLYEVLLQITDESKLGKLRLDELRRTCCRI